MYLSSDSLRTRMSLIRSILHSSPSMSSTVLVESAIETASSAEKQGENKTLNLPGSSHMMVLFLQDSSKMTKKPKTTLTVWLNIWLHILVEGDSETVINAIFLLDSHQNSYLLVLLLR